jgi:Tol biopolymer transport system component
MLVLFAAPVVGQQTPEELLQSALYKQQVEGDLEGAREILQTLIEDFAEHREVAANALVLLGRVHETLGSTQAERAYQRVLNEYPEQRAAADEARARLAALTQQAVAATPSGPVARLLLSDQETNVNNFFDMQVSPDGRYVAYTQMGNDGALLIRDLESGDTTKLAEGWNDMPVWSPDGRRIAYGSRGPWAVAEVSTLKVVDVATQTSSTIPAFDGMSLEPRAWSPDGIWLACKFSVPNEGTGSLLLNLETGDTVMLARRSNRVAVSFSPDGEHVAFTVFEDSSRHDIHVMRLADGTRHRITEGPDNDRRPMWSPDGDVLVYSNQAGAMVVPMAGGQVAGPAQLLRANGFDQPAGWTASGDFYYVAYNTTRKAYRIPVDPQSRRATGLPQIMNPAPDRVIRFAWSPDMRYVAFAPRGGIIQVLATETGTLSAYPVGSEADASNLWWSGDSKEALFVAHRRSREAKGGTVLGLNPVTGVVRELLTRAEDVARIHLSPDGSKKVLYSGDWGGRRRQLILADAAATEGVVLADESQFEGNLANWVRPAFSPDGASVLFGTVKYGENIIDANHLWVASVGGAEPRKLVSEPWIRYAVWHPSSDYIVYTVRHGKDEHAIYVIDVRTGERQEVTLPDEFTADVHQWSPDGKWLGVTRDAGQIELWMVQNVLAEGSGSR